MKTQKTILVLSVLFLAAASISLLSGRQKTAADADQIVDRLIPRPQKIEVAGVLPAAADKIYLNLPQIAYPLISTAADILRPYARGSEGFELRLVLASDNCPLEIRAALGNLPNRDQACAIQPVERKESGRGLLLAAETPLGLLYAARTLSQILGTPPSDPAQKMSVPKVTVCDWPDLAERGLWGGNAAQDLAWMAERKLNVVEVHPRGSGLMTTALPVPNWMVPCSPKLSASALRSCPSTTGMGKRLRRWSGWIIWSSSPGSPPISLTKGR